MSLVLHLPTPLHLQLGRVVIGDSLARPLEPSSPQMHPQMPWRAPLDQSDVVVVVVVIVVKAIELGMSLPPQMPVRELLHLAVAWFASRAEQLRRDELFRLLLLLKVVVVVVVVVVGRRRKRRRRRRRRRKSRY